MAEYINRERARFEAKRFFKNLYEIQEDLDELFCMLPAEDVAPVRHEKWIFVDTGDENFFLCSGCRNKEYWENEYCPKCGAKMDKED